MSDETHTALDLDLPVGACIKMDLLGRIYTVCKKCGGEELVFPKDMGLPLIYCDKTDDYQILKEGLLEWVEQQREHHKFMLTMAGSTNQWLRDLAQKSLDELNLIWPERK